MQRFLGGVVVGVALATVGTAAAQMFVEVTGRGVLRGYEVQVNGRTVCSSPMAYPNFRGGNYIVCE